MSIENIKSIIRILSIIIFVIVEILSWLSIAKTKIEYKNSHDGWSEHLNYYQISFIGLNVSSVFVALILLISWAWVY